MSTAFAFNPFYPTTIIEKKNDQSASVTKKVQNNFIDFSGIWKGKCIFGNYETEETVIIKNTAKYIIFGNKQLFIGNSLYSESNAGPNVTSFDFINN